MPPIPTVHLCDLLCLSWIPVQAPLNQFPNVIEKPRQLLLFLPLRCIGPKNRSSPDWALVDSPMRDLDTTDVNAPFALRTYPGAFAGLFRRPMPAPEPL